MTRIRSQLASCKALVFPFRLKARLSHHHEARCGGASDAVAHWPYLAQRPGMLQETLGQMCGVIQQQIGQNRPFIFQGQKSQPIHKEKDSQVKKGQKSSAVWLLEAAIHVER